MEESKKITPEEAQGVVGGADWISWDGDNYTLWFRCDHCGYTEAVHSGSRSLPCRIKGTWECPCGHHTQKFELVNKMDGLSDRGPYYKFPMS